MDPMQIDRWTKRLVRTAVGELRGPLGGLPVESSELLGELAQRVRQVVAGDRALADGRLESAAGIGEELAMLVFLTVAADRGRAELSPELLLALNRSLTRTLRAGMSQSKEVRS